MDRKNSARGNPDVLKAVALSLPAASWILLIFPPHTDYVQSEFFCKIALGLFLVTFLADCLRTSPVHTKFLPTLLGLFALFVHWITVPI